MVWSNNKSWGPKVLTTLFYFPYKRWHKFTDCNKTKGDWEKDFLSLHTTWIYFLSVSSYNMYIFSFSSISEKCAFLFKTSLLFYSTVKGRDENGRILVSWMVKRPLNENLILIGRRKYLDNCHCSSAVNTNKKPKPSVTRESELTIECWASWNRLECRK